MPRANQFGGSAKFTRVSKNLELLPSSQIGEVRGRKGMEFAIAILPEVTAAVNKELLLAEAKAHARLIAVRAQLGELGDKMEAGVTIKAQKALGRNRVDAYLILDDQWSSTPNAMAIEMGRDEYEVTRTDSNGVTRTYRVGAMEGVGILHAGFGFRPGRLRGTGGGSVS